MNKFLIATCLLALAISTMLGNVVPTDEDLDPVATAEGKAKYVATEKVAGKDGEPSTGQCLDRLGKKFEEIEIPESVNKWNENNVKASDLTEEDIENIAQNFGGQVEDECHQVRKKVWEIFSHTHDDEGSCIMTVETGTISDHPVMGPVLNVVKVCKMVKQYFMDHDTDTDSYTGSDTGSSTESDTDFVMVEREQA